MSLNGAIKKTVNYAKRYGMKLSNDQLWQRLISKQRWSRSVIGSGKSILSKETKRKIRVAKGLVKRLKKNKDILMVAITGSVAAEHCKKMDDIDILIVTKKNRMWLTRLWVIENERNKRRFGERVKSDDFCFNMWLEEKCLKLPENKRDLRSAVDLILMKVIWERGGVYKNFLQANRWARKWVATGWEARKRQSEKVRKKENNKDNFVKDILNLLAFVGQYIYMWPKIEKEKVNLRQAFFHQA